MGIRGVKTGNMEKLRGLTEQDLYKMSRSEMESLLASTSKNVAASVRRLEKSSYKDVSPFLSKRDENRYPMPREIKKSTAARMGTEQLKQELRDLSYIANLKTANVSGVRKYVSKFKKETGKDLNELSSADWEKIRKKMEEGYDSTSVIKAYDVESEDFDDEALDLLETASEKAKQEASNDISNRDMFNILN